MENLWTEFINNSFLVRLAVAVLEVLIGFAIAPMVRNWILGLKKKNPKIDQGLLTFSGSMVSVFIKFLALVIAMAQIGVNTDMIVGAFSAIGLGVSFALRDSMANVAGGVQILITHPFRVGDYIQFQSFEGHVREIEMMFTTLQTYSNEEVIIPNSALVTDAVINFSKFPNRRIKIDVETAIDRDYESFRAACYELMERDPRILKDPLPVTRISGFTTSGNGVIVTLLCFSNLEDYWDVFYDLTGQVQDLRVSMNILQPVSTVRLTPGSEDLKA